MISIDQHNIEIGKNLEYWNSKPLLQELYADFYRLIVANLKKDLPGKTVELGSGIGNFKKFYPDCVSTDIFPNPWIDQVESAYALSFANNSISNLVLLDVWHHLEFPGTALKEFERVLMPGGRLIILDPGISLLGLLVWGAFHHEPMRLFKKIEWFAPASTDLKNTPYYAAQGNASRIFGSKKYQRLFGSWNRTMTKKLATISYVLSGGYSKPALYPQKALRLMRKLDKICNYFPLLFATRMFVVLEKK